ncbi:S8 family peptidase [Natrialbaceae archaeon A-CW3]
MTMGVGATASTSGTPSPEIVTESPIEPAQVQSTETPDAVESTNAGEQYELTLVTGHTVTVFETDGDRRYTVEDTDGSDVPYKAVDRPEGTYVVPAQVDLSIYSEELFNVDLLIEQGYADDDVDGTPVIVMLEDAPEVGTLDLQGFEHTGSIDAIDAQAGVVTGDAGFDVATTDSDAIEGVYLDTTFEVELDESTDAVRVGDARDAFDVTGEGVQIAVLDTGIDANHPDFGDRVVDQTDFTGDGIGDRQGHGTHVAGIIAGDGTESDGEYVGMAPGAELVDVKVLGDAGTGSLSDIAAGVEYAVEEDVDVISMSLGGPVQENDPIVDAVEYAVGEGVTVVVSAGNDGPGYRTISSPAVADGAISVGATDATFEGIADFSSSGPTQLGQLVKPEVVAPGWTITATGSDEAGESPYTEKSGTSMASPHVSGLVALLLEDEADLSPSQVEDRLVTTADYVPDDEADDIYRQGTGQVNASAALGSDIVIHDAVRSFGIIDEPRTESTVVPVENRGDETIELEASAMVTNVDEGDALDGVELNRSTVTIEPGDVEYVELSFDTSGAYGLNSGVLTFEDDDATYRSAFGFVKGLEVTVEKEFNDKNVWNDFTEALYVWSTDGTYEEFDWLAFGFQSDHSFVVPDSEMELTFWSIAEYEDVDSDAFAEIAYTVKEDVTVDQNNSHVVLDETETVPRDIDTSATPHHGSLDVIDYEANVHARLPDGTAHSFATGGFGKRAHFTPINHDEYTNITTNYVMVPEDQVGDGGDFDSPYVYSLVGATTAIDANAPSFVVDPDTFAEEAFTFHRTADESYSASAFMMAADQETYPGLLGISSRSDIGTERESSTWIRNAEGAYEMAIHAEPTTSFRYVGTDWSPEVGETTETPVNVAPFVPTTDWRVEDGWLDVDAAWAADQGERRMAAYQGALGTPPNEIRVTLDGETVLDESALTGEVTIEGAIGPDTEVAIDLEGNSLSETRNVETYARYVVASTNEDTANTPPNIESVNVLDYDPNEPLDERTVTLEVDVENEADLRQFRAYYADDAEALPSEDTAWRNAGTQPVDDGTYRIHLVTNPDTDSLDLAFSAVDRDGNEMEVATIGALPVDYNDTDTKEMIVVQP